MPVHGFSPAECRAAVEDVVRLAGPAVARQREAVRTALDGFVKDYERRGQPPPVFGIVGRQTHELPLNRVLAWLLDPESGHGLGREPLCELARLLQFRELLQDLRDGAPPPEVLLERAFPDEESGGDEQPDLLVITERCVLLIENKVNAPESKNAQYSRYRERLVGYAGRTNRIPHAYLWARGDRTCPRDWNGFWRHSRLARAMGHHHRELAGRLGESHWGVIAHGLVVHALREEPDVGKLVAEAKGLLDRWDRLAAAKLARAREIGIEFSHLEDEMTQAWNPGIECYDREQLAIQAVIREYDAFVEGHFADLRVRVEGLADRKHERVTSVPRTPAQTELYAKTRRAWVWVFIAGKTIVYKYSPSRSGETPVVDAAQPVPADQPTSG